MPIANNFISDINDEEYTFDLELGWCPECYLVQLMSSVPTQLMFNSDYAYFSSTSESMKHHFQGMAEEIIHLTSKINEPFIVEVGCNDGILLKHLAEKGIDHLGIEASANVAEHARGKGVNVVNTFFNLECAEKISDEYRSADVIYGANTICHVDEIESLIKGIALLLKDDGYFIFEDPYLPEILQKTSFDQIYDEHIFYFSGLSVSNLLRKNGLQLVNMKPLEVHGGSMRYYARKTNAADINSNIKKLMEQETKNRLDSLAGYSQFKNNITEICTNLRTTLQNLKKAGSTIAAYGATSKSTTLLNYSGIGPDIINYISDTTPTKIDKYSPGIHIPIKPYSHFISNPPDYALLLAWNHKKEIIEKEKQYLAKGGKFIIPFPEVRIIQ